MPPPRPNPVVHIVVDPTAGPLILTLAHRGPVWAIASDVNTPYIQQAWRATSGPGSTTPPPSNVTSFAGIDGESAQDACVRILDTVSDHVDSYGADTPWTSVRVYGATPTQPVVDAFAAYGFVAIAAVDAGFIAQRPD